MIYKHLFDSVEDMLTAANESTKRRMHQDVSDAPGWIGRQFSDWTDLMANANGDWPVGQRIVAEMLHELESVTLPPLKVIRRKRHFSSAVSVATGTRSNGIKQLPSACIRSLFPGRSWEYTGISLGFS